jgi:hypothetical protein
MSVNQRPHLLAAVGLMLIVLIGCGASPKPQVNLLSMGDWGNNGPKQARVAEALTKHVRSSDRKFDAMLTAGDNFYVKFTGVDDPKWRSMFEEMYPQSVIDFPFYIALGNHDYEKNDQGRPKWEIEREYAQVNPNSRWKMPSRWYRLEFPKEEPLVTALMLDSDQPLLGESVWNEQLEWLKTELARPRKSKWLIVVAHHPLFSNGNHGDNGVLQRTWGPLMQEAGVDLYICGHDHDLQHLQLKDWKPTFMLVGGGGATTRPMAGDLRGPFSKAAHGFADLQFTPNLITVKFIDVEGAVMHAFTRTPGGKVKVLQSSPSDRAVPRTVKSITRDNAPPRSTTAPFEKD